MLGRSRIGAFAGTTLYLATLLLAGYHQGAEAHGYCAEHGAIVHLDESGHGHEALRVPLGAFAGSESEHADHGCVVAEWLGQSVHQRTSCVISRLPQQSLTMASTGIRASHSNISLLRLSPKVSPPA